MKGGKTRDRDRGIGPGNLVAWFILLVAAMGMLAANPRGAGPDESMHEITAWYLSAHVLPPTATETFTVPSGFLPTRPCFAGNNRATVACEPPITDPETWTSTANVLSYPPPYYWLVGAGERIAAAVDPAFAPTGGRLASILLNLGTLLLLAVYMRRRGSWWGSAFLAVCTPMVAFLDAVVNSSGWEITCGIVMGAVLWETITSWRPRSDRRPASIVPLVLTGLGLGLARSSGFLWVGALSVSALALGPSLDRRTALRVAIAAAPGIAVGMLWYVTHLITAANSPLMPQGGTDFWSLLRTTLLMFPFRLFEMFGMIGWLDTPMPFLLALAETAALVVLLRHMPPIGRTAKFVGICGIFLGPSLLETVASVDHRLWWQGRYTLPFALGFLMLLLLRSGELTQRTLGFVASLSVFAMGTMVWVTVFRYDLGLGDFELPLWTAQPAMQPLPVAAAVAIGAALVATSVWLFVRAYQLRPDAPSARAAMAGADASTSQATSGSSAREVAL